MVKEFYGNLILHLIDHATRFSVATSVALKSREEITKTIFKSWRSIFGPPLNFFSDNGGKFSNDDFHEMYESMNIKIKKTAAESPFSNKLCERHNAVLEYMRITHNKNINLDIYNG